jgi:acyl-CoA thioesterase II
MHFDQILQQIDDGQSRLSLPDSWAQGRTLFGGVVAGALYQAIKVKAGSDRVLRSLNTHFIGPITPDQDFDIQVEIIREGKNVTVAEARAVQKGNIAATVVAIFGTSRDSKIVVEHNTTHEMAVPKKPKSFLNIPKVTPKFFKNMELFIDQGSLPFTKSKKSHYHGWMRFKQTPQAVTDAHIICLVDAWPPTVLQMAFGPKPASTVSWNLELIHPHQEIKAGDWLAYQADTRQAYGGYAHTEANVWNQQGELVAISRQLVAVFD